MTNIYRTKYFMLGIRFDCCQMRFGWNFIDVNSNKLASKIFQFFAVDIEASIHYPWAIIKVMMKQTFILNSHIFNWMLNYYLNKYLTSAYVLLNCYNEMALNWKRGKVFHNWFILFRLFAVFCIVTLILCRFSLACWTYA